MDIKSELLSKTLADVFVHRLDLLGIDPNTLIDTAAVLMLSEIQEVIQNDKISDFEAIEQIVRIFEKHKINTGVRHDFG